MIIMINFNIFFTTFIDEAALGFLGFKVTSSPAINLETVAPSRLSNILCNLSFLSYPVSSYPFFPRTSTQPFFPLSFIFNTNTFLSCIRFIKYASLRYLEKVFMSIPLSYCCVTETEHPPLVLHVPVIE